MKKRAQNKVNLRVLCRRNPGHTLIVTWDYNKGVKGQLGALFSLFLPVQQAFVPPKDGEEDRQENFTLSNNLHQLSSLSRHPPKITKLSKNNRIDMQM